jgi:rare lipoprotein A
MRTVIFAALGVVVSVSAAAADELGQASYYTSPQHSGMIAAHKTLPFGARVRVTNLDYRRIAFVTIVDRGPFGRGRVIDISTSAPDELGFRQAGDARVKPERL